ETALGDVAHRELPVLRRLLQAVEKAFALFLLGDVEEELQDHSALSRQIALKGSDVLEALAPDVLGDKFRRNSFLGEDVRMHPRHQAFLVVGAIEDTDAAALRQRVHAAPHEIMIELLRARLLERGDLAAL